MNLNQALSVIKSAKNSRGEKKRHCLVCGFEPMHLKTLLRAHLLERLPEADIEIENGVYGDLRGNLARAAQSEATGAAVVVEWSDIDPRLGLRTTGGWSEDVKADILASGTDRCGRIETEIGKLAARMPVAVVPPGLPLPPLGNTIGAQASVIELELDQLPGAFLSRISRLPGVRVVSPSRLNRIPLEERLDAKMELLAGFPYSVEYADLVASSITDVLYQASPKKGLITDLDDTFWSGIVGEAGPDRVTWHQESHTQTHGLYQQMLGRLAGAGVLLAVCSKNELSTVEAALSRKDLLMKAESLFPVCANWEPKSQSVARVLKTWNIGEDAVVFIDDSPMELEEVQRAFPGITCRRFTGKDPAKVWQLLSELRDLFGKPTITEEDRLRQQSIRSSAQIQELGEAAESPDFLRSLDATVTIDWRIDPADKRPLELINKTNQFNLNGHRIDEGEWQRRIEDPDAVLAVVSYTDKFGPLGKVAVLLGKLNDKSLKVSHWVMSCRAFSRRLEHHTLDGLFRGKAPDEIEFAFEATSRNKPLQDFFSASGIAQNSEGTYRLDRGAFPGGSDALPHKVVDLTL